MTAPSPDSIKDSVERSLGFVDWLVDVLRGKNPVKKLLLVDVLFFAAFNPYFPALFKRIANRNPPVWYEWLFWSLFILVFIAAVITALRVKKEQEIEGKWDDRGAIKGLLPFGFADAEIFRRLQREDSIHECLPALTDFEFRFGLLCGESGCGKTSFLQAGLWPRLSEQGNRCLYVKFTDLDPLDSIRLALVEQFKLSREMVEAADLLDLLDAASQSGTQSTILFFDQFEQFFVHYKTAKHRRPFVQALAGWFRKQPPLPVKILICIREDFAGRLIELQKAMGYSLGPRQSIRLDKFEPEKAAKILQVIAETTGLSCDEAFVKEFTEQQLAGEDGGVSPVDIQILAWMIASQTSREGRAFDRASFQKLGGIEGLLERFLSRALEARETERQQVAIKVLLALVDLDGNARAGVSTLDELRAKLAGTVSEADAREALAWLVRPDVRLVNSSDEGYELAHERLIPALRRIAGKALSSADQANRLLDRRVNEWMGNNRAARYLLTWRELRLIRRQWPYLDWGSQKPHKESLLLQTMRRWRVRVALACCVFVLVSGSGIGFGFWLNSDAGQVYRIESEIMRLSERIDDGGTVSLIVESLVFSGRSKQAFQIVEKVEDPGRKSHIIEVIVGATANVAATKQPAQFGEAKQIADRIEYPSHRAAAFCKLAEIIVRVDPAQAVDLLEPAYEIANGVDNRIDNSLGNAKAAALAQVAGAFAVVAGTTSSKPLLERAEQIAEQIQSPPHQSVAFSRIAENTAKLDPKRSKELFEQAERFAKDAMNFPAQGDTYDPSAGLGAVSTLVGAMARAAVANRSEELLEQAIEIAKNVNDSYTWTSLQEAMAKTDDISPALFERAVAVAARVDNPSEKAGTWGAVARAKAEVFASTNLSDLSIEAERFAEIVADFNGAYALVNIAEDRAATAPDQSLEMLRRVQQSIGSMNPRRQGSLLSAIAGALARIAVATHSSRLMEEAKGLAASIGPYYRCFALSAIVEALAKLESGPSAEQKRKTSSVSTTDLNNGSWRGPRFSSSWNTSVAAAGARPRSKGRRSAAANRRRRGKHSGGSKPHGKHPKPPPATHPGALSEGIDVKEAVKLLKEAERLASDEPTALACVAAAASKIAVAIPSLGMSAGPSRDLLNRAKALVDGEDESRPDDSLSAIAACMAKVAVSTQDAKLFEEAGQYPDRIRDPVARVFALCAVSEAAADAGNLGKVNAGQTTGLLKQAWKYADQIPIGHAFRKAVALSEVAHAMAMIDANRSAKIYGAQPRELLEEATRLANRGGRPDLKAAALACVVGATARVAQSNPPTNLVERVEQVAEGIDIFNYQAYALSAVASALPKVDSAKSAELFEKAERIGRAADNPDAQAVSLETIADRKDHALSAIAAAMARRAGAIQSTEMLLRAKKMADETAIPFNRHSALSAVAETAVKLKNLSLAREAGFANADVYRASSLSIVLRTRAEMGNPSLADAIREMVP